MFVAKRRALDHTQPRPSGRVAESGLRHSTRNRAWGNPPWVRIPPLPPELTLDRVVTKKSRKFGLDLRRFCTAYCMSAEGLRYYLLCAGIHRLLAWLLAGIHR